MYKKLGLQAVLSLFLDVTSVYSAQNCPEFLADGVDLPDALTKIVMNDRHHGRYNDGAYTWTVYDPTGLIEGTNRGRNRNYQEIIAEWDAHKRDAGYQVTYISPTAVPATPAVPGNLNVELLNPAGQTTQIAGARDLYDRILPGDIDGYNGMYAAAYQLFVADLTAFPNKFMKVYLIDPQLNPVVVPPPPPGGGAPIPPPPPPPPPPGGGAPIPPPPPPPPGGGAPIPPPPPPPPGGGAPIPPPPPPPPPPGGGGTPHATPLGTPHVTPTVTPPGTPHVTPQGTPTVVTPPGTPHVTPPESPRGAPHGGGVPPVVPVVPVAPPPPLPGGGAPVVPVPPVVGGGAAPVGGAPVRPLVVPVASIVAPLANVAQPMPVNPVQQGAITTTNTGAPLNGVYINAQGKKWLYKNGRKITLIN